MKKDKINSLALCSVVFPLGCSTFYGIFSSYILDTAKTDTFIAMIIGYIISLIISFAIIKLFSLRTDETLPEKVKFAYGKLSIFFNIIIIICSILLYIFITYRLTSFLSGQYLVRTNKTYIYLLVLFITYNMANKGEETTTRVTTICIYICLCIYLLVIYGLWNEINFENYLPIITTSKTNILKSSLVFSLYFSAPIFFINIVKKDDLVDKNKFNKYFFIMHLFTFLIVFFAILLTLGAYGVKLANIFDYPIYTVLNKIQISTFIDSVENVFIIFWLLSGINAASVALLFIFNCIKKTFNFKYKTNKVLNYIVILILFLIPTIFYKNNNYLESFDYISFPSVIAGILILLIFLTLFILIIKKSYKN
ncbi:MAG: GerAB/ArcD/ProY family transporter [bacterium]|nr:GerAB/ArcD/ProY family transporter [bacterium]